MGRGGGGNPEDCSKASATEVRGGAGEKVEPGGAEGMEGRRVTSRPEFHGGARVTSDQGVDGGTRIPGGAGGITDHDKDEGALSQVETDGSED